VTQRKEQPQQSETTQEKTEWKRPALFFNRNVKAAEANVETN